MKRVVTGRPLHRPSGTRASRVRRQSSTATTWSLLLEAAAAPAGRRNGSIVVAGQQLLNARSDRSPPQIAGSQLDWTMSEENRSVTTVGGFPTSARLERDYLVGSAASGITEIPEQIHEYASGCRPPGRTSGQR